MHVFTKNNREEREFPAKWRGNMAGTTGYKLGWKHFTYEACKTLQWLCELRWAIFSVMSFDYNYQNSFWLCFLNFILRLSNENASRNRMGDDIKNWL